MTEKKGDGGKGGDGGEKGDGGQDMRPENAVPSERKKTIPDTTAVAPYAAEKEGRLFGGSGQDGEGGGSFAKTERGGKGRGGCHHADRFRRAAAALVTGAKP